MSYAIFDLDIEQPPATCRRVRTPEGWQWIVRCDMCGHRTRPRPLLSAALRDQYRHGQRHATEMVRRAANRVPRRVHTIVPISPPTCGEPLGNKGTGLSRSTQLERKAVAV